MYEPNTGSAGTPAVEMRNETASVGGSATISISVRNVDRLVVEDLWTDWEVTGTTTGGATFTNDVPANGRCRFDWDTVQSSGSLSLTLSIPDRYVDGEHVIECTGTDSSADTAATGTASILVGDPDFGYGGEALSPDDDRYQGYGEYRYGGYS